MKNFNLNELLSIAETTNFPQITSATHSGGSVCSFGVVFNKNGKRLSFSKALADKLDLGNTVDLFPIPKRGVLLVAKKLTKAAVTCSLSGKKDEKRIAYHAGAAEMITNMFQLDFTTHTSYSFQNIEFDESDGIHIAMISMTDPKNKTKPVQEAS